uniref:Uncharacterized protein n=1 Tax=Cyanothece sp. (strain PCC 7425 / ATCC 29141) TaxID=395961 RepID=B8HQM8_CYAP4
MKKGKAFVLVGHKQWGKSRTLKSLTNDSRYVKKITINDQQLFIRRMSNDDEPESLMQFVRKLNTQRCTNVILTLCPNFHDSSRHQTLSILDELSKKYELFFWILRFKYASDEMISDDEIRNLNKYGEVEVFTREQPQSTERAEEFKAFVSNRL